MKDIHKMKADLEQRLEVINEIINGDAANGFETPSRSTRARGRMSPATRAKIASAAKARWARIKNEEKKTSKK